MDKFPKKIKLAPHWLRSGVLLASWLMSKVGSSSNSSVTFLGRK